MFNMKVALCVCGRLENRYAVEFVEYYKQLGFDHIYIGDNNREGEEHFEDVLQQYIDEQFVTVYDYRTLFFEQLNFYNDMYNKLSNDYDWITFYDFDEFLTLVKDTNIKEYLSRDCFKNANQILINWKTYTDNDLVYDDGRPCIERFTTPMDNDKCIQYDGLKENSHIKCIIKTNIDNAYFDGPHCISNKTLIDSTYNNCGNLIIYENQVIPFNTINYELAYIKHFLTKTIDEFINNKNKKWKCWEFHQYSLDLFFKVNNITGKKIKYLIKHGYNVDDLIKTIE